MEMVSEHALIEFSVVSVAAVTGARTVAIAERVDYFGVAVQIATADQTHLVRTNWMSHDFDALIG